MTDLHDVNVHRQSMICMRLGELNDNVQWSFKLDTLIVKSLVVPHDISCHESEGQSS